MVYSNIVFCENRPLPSITDYIGHGLNGKIYGLRNRMKELIIGQFYMLLPLTACPEMESFRNAKINSDKIGSIGNELLRRFKIIFDYANRQIYLSKNRNVDKFYCVNMSCLEIAHDGVEWEKVEVSVTLKRCGSNKVNVIIKCN